MVWQFSLSELLSKWLNLWKLYIVSDHLYNLPLQYTVQCARRDERESLIVMVGSLICFSLQNMISSLITAMCLLTDNFMSEQYPNREILPSSPVLGTHFSFLH